MHDAHLGDVITWVKTTTAQVTNTADRALLQTDLRSLFLTDFRNQFRPQTYTKLAQFVQDNTVNLGTGQIKKIGTLGVDDLLNFYFSTPYAQRLNGLNDELRRFRNVVTVAGGYTLPTDAQAKEEEAKGLIRVYQDYLKGKEQISHFSAFNTAILQPAKNYLVSTYVTAKNLGVTIDGDVQVGEDQASFSRSAKKKTDADVLLGTQRLSEKPIFR
jgi:hypothetical protein